MDPVLAQKNLLFHTPEELNEARIVRRRIAEAAYRSGIRRREDCFEPRIILLRIVALAFMMRVRPGNNICISFGRPLAIAMGMWRENTNQHYCDYQSTHTPNENKISYGHWD